MSRTGVTARALGLAAAAGLLAASAPASAQAVASAQTPVCQSIALPTPAGTHFSSVNGGDPSGRYLVGVASGTGFSQGVLWVDGRLKPIGQRALEPYVQTEFDAVNSRGEIVGDRMTDDSSFHTDAFVYRHGRFTLLPAPHKGDATEALAINARGDIVGYALGASGRQAVEWPANRPGTVRVLTTPGAAPGFASGIDADGTVVGYLGSLPTSIPYVWPAHGRGHRLPLQKGVVSGDALAVRQGWATGNVLDPVTGSSVAVLWNLRTGHVTVYKNEQGAAQAVNRWGTIGVAGGAIVYTDGRVVRVNGWVNVVTDRGVAAGATSQFAGHAVIWPCRPSGH